MVSPLTGKWVDRGDERHPVLASAVLMLAGASAMTFFYTCAILGKGLVLALLGLSYGIGNVALQAAMLKASPQQMIGTTSGLFKHAGTLVPFCHLPCLACCLVRKLQVLISNN